jgi:tripartite-type tricarboxylate transporter receptor subunit TctC
MFSTKSRTDYHRAIAFAAALTAALASGLARAASQSADGVCVGKQLRMVIAAGAGGGYDIYARILVTHLTRHIPGNPTIIDQNMPTAAGMQATNWAFTA